MSCELQSELLAITQMLIEAFPDEESARPVVRFVLPPFKIYFQRPADQFWPDFIQTALSTQTLPRLLELTCNNANTASRRADFREAIKSLEERGCCNAEGAHLRGGRVAETSDTRTRWPIGGEFREHLTSDNLSTATCEPLPARSSQGGSQFMRERLTAAITAEMLDLPFDQELFSSVAIATQQLRDLLERLKENEVGSETPLSVTHLLRLRVALNGAIDCSRPHDLRRRSYGRARALRGTYFREFSSSVDN